MEKYIKNLLIVLFILSGVYCNALAWDQLNAMNENNTFYVSQLAYFMLLSGTLGGLLLFKFNKFVSALCIAFSIGLLKTFLFANAPKLNMFESALIGYSAFIIYFFVRYVDLREDFLKWFLVPACANIILVFIQFFDNSSFLPMPFDGVSGFIGREGMTALYLALTLPIFYKYFKIGIIPCYAAIILCNGAVALVSALIVGLFHLYNKVSLKKFVIVVVLLLLSIAPFCNKQNIDNVKNDVHLRLSMMAGTFDGIKHNPILGWGVGSFLPIISKVKPKDSVYLGKRFNTEGAIMNHPHNELLSGWWKIGIAFPIIIFMLLGDFLRKRSGRLLTTYCIILTAILISIGWFFPLPALTLIIVAFAIHENEKKGEQHG